MFTSYLTGAQNKHQQCKNRQRFSMINIHAILAQLIIQKSNHNGGEKNVINSFLFIFTYGPVST